MGKTVSTITQQLNETEAMLAPFRRTLRRSDQYIFDGIFAAARRHIAAIGEVESLLPFQIALLAMLLEQAKDIAVLQEELDGIYKWLVFPPSKRDSRVPVPNRYFGAFQNGEIKARGIALRRHDTSKYVADTQMGILRILATSDDPCKKNNEVQEYMRKQISLLREGRISAEDLMVTQTLSRPLDAYRVSSPTARAARQLEAHGKIVQPGMRIRFLHVYDGSGIRAWDVGDVQIKMVNVKRYIHLLKRAEEEVLNVFEKPTRSASFAFRQVQS